MLVSIHKGSCFIISKFSVNEHLLLGHSFCHLLLFLSRQVGAREGFIKLYRKKGILEKIETFC